MSQLGIRFYYGNGEYRYLRNSETGALTQSKELAQTFGGPRVAELVAMLLRHQTPNRVPQVFSLARSR